jgi:OPA family glycerol-3-phosphate transporter-like MFS transporter
MNWAAAIVLVVLFIVIGAYFRNNPMRHGRKFMIRRFVNWFPLGMTYAFLYMARYNLIVAKSALGVLMSKEDFGIIFGVGTGVYALSFLVNGPLVDRIGGKKGILIAAIGAAGSNIMLGVLAYLLLTNRLRTGMVAAFSAIYALNMYFQSYGAVSIIKVKAYWFHVRERGVFGAIFGALISIGSYFAFDWGQGIVNLTTGAPPADAGWAYRLFRSVFGASGGTGDATWAVFYIPAAILVAWAILDVWLIKDTPEEAGFPPFDTCDASSGQMHVEFTAWQLVKKVLTSPVLLLIAVVELTSGVFRNSVVQWYQPFTSEVKQPGAEFFLQNWGLLICIFGIIGGFAGGIISDKLFQSRRGPPAVILCGAVLLMALVMSAFLFSSPVIVGAAAVGIWMAGVGVTSLMSGTAATDFGGRKATATSSGIVDGFAYLGGSVQSFCLGYLVTSDWRWWPIFFVPFAILGGFVAIKIWHALPAATRKYIADVESKQLAAGIAVEGTPGLRS